MKITALVIACLGFTMLLFAGVLAASSGAMGTLALNPFGNQMVPLALPVFGGVAALGLAVLIWAFGGRGYVVTQEPMEHDLSPFHLSLRKGDQP